MVLPARDSRHSLFTNRHSLIRMALIDFILNVAGLLLWFNWRAVRFDPLVKTAPATLTGTLRRAEPSRFKRWHLLATLAGLLLARAFVYWQIGSAANWT